MVCIPNDSEAKGAQTLPLEEAHAYLGHNEESRRHQ